MSTRRRIWLFSATMPTGVAAIARHYLVDPVQISVGIRSNLIGAIDLERDFSYFEVEESAARRVWNSVNNATLDGRTVQVRNVTGKKKRYKGQPRMPNLTDP
ncbi:MAG: DbpA RNA binding domain-containing protein [Desulfobacterales bacterium]|jgi:superfamily II DNA/RNA helicase